MTNDNAVAKAISQLGLQPLKNGEPAVPQGSRQKVVEPTKPDAAPVEKVKKISLSLTTSQEARCIREAQVLNISVKQYLQKLVDDKLATGIGAPLIGGASYQGKKVTAPTNTFGREV